MKKLNLFFISRNLWSFLFHEVCSLVLLQVLQNDKTQFTLQTPDNQTALFQRVIITPVEASWARRLGLGDLAWNKVEGFFGNKNRSDNVQKKQIFIFHSTKFAKITFRNSRKIQKRFKGEPHPLVHFWNPPIFCCWFRWIPALEHFHDLEPPFSNHWFLASIFHFHLPRRAYVGIFQFFFSWF